MKRHITPDLVRAALACVPPDLPREEWARVGMAIKSEMGADGLSLFDNWSQGSERYNKADTRDTWQSIKAGGRVSIGTLFHIAKGHGFKFEDKPGEARPDSASIKAMAEARKARDEAERKATEAAHNKAAELAAKLWNEATETTSTPYLERKGVKGVGVRADAHGVLLVPMRDERGVMWNLQRIAPNKPAEGPEKRFLKGGRKAGLMHWIGEPNGAGVLLLCEGFATGASLYQATGHPVCVTFDAGNLPTVAKAVRGLRPSALLVMCGDNDKATETSAGRNPGKEKALQAAKAVRGVATWPEGLPDGLTDFNDAHQTQGLEAVKARIQEAIQSMQDKSNKASQEGKASDKPATPDVPEVLDRFLVSDEGVFYLGQDQDGRATAPQWICSRLDVTATTRDEDGQGWGFLLTFTDPAGTLRTWAMPARMLAGDGGEYRAALLNMGLRIASGTNARNRLTQYLQTRQPAEMARCVDRLGWHGRAYVLPRETLSQADDERIVYQADGLAENPFKQRGTVEQWRDKVAAFCVGNDRLVFAVCCALAGALVRHAGVDSGGFHLRGGSSCGKTTALKVAASVWGGASYMQRWRATDNALESIAAQHCDGLLILDELAQVDPKTAGECAYMLSNEQGKARNTRTMQARPRLSWRLLFLSAGEISLSQHMAEGGKRSKAGQELRMADVPADAGQGLGLFNVLHELPSGAALSMHLGKACETHHGTAGRAWLQWLVEHVDTLRDACRAGIEQHAQDWIPEAASGQVQRVGRRFALLAVAGELATEAGITGWPQGEATRGVRACFNAWLASRGGIGDAEVTNMLSQVQRLLEERGASCFAWMNRVADDRAPNPTERWGFRRLVDKKGKPISRMDDANEYGRAVEFLDDDGTEVEYFVLVEAFRNKLCEGYDPVTVARLLAKRGHLVPESDRRLDRKEYIKGQGYARVFRIKASILADEGGDI
ncbi:DUF927 domain-containing protein [Aquabacterium sp.]|uniref:DUF927 domain-containing protein n=1 Tax=Aquabacterium sp. TaxID=1872578 RepID=UPI002E34BD7D|nr:DUF927 domain-containing protein [Aquabacterium sp.]HEX5310299.1 DUF927 domain-containing protein [Aquabacterium sp.]